MSTIVSTPSNAPTSATFRPNLLQRVAGFIFGYDIFISYSRADAFYYAARLAKVLVKNGFICYLDQYHTTPGKRVPDVVDNALRQSTSLILIGTKNAVASDNVAHEIQVFNENPRNAIAINVDDELTQNSKWEEMIPGLPKTSEIGEAVLRGRPSKQVFSRIFDSGKFTRRNKQLKRRLFILIGIITVLLSGTGIVSYKIVIKAWGDLDRARAEQQRASHEAFLAQQGRLEAENLRFVAEVDRRHANASAKIANEMRQQAENDTLEAQALEKQATLNAAAAHEQELVAKREQRIATAERLAAHAQRVLLDQPQFSLQLGLKALGTTQPEDPPVGSAWQTLHDSLGKSGGAYFSGDPADNLLAVQFSPKSHWLLVQSERTGLAVWDTTVNFDRGPTERKLKVLENSTAQCKYPAFSPSGEMVAAQCPDYSFTVWDLRTSEQIVPPVDTSALPENLVSDDARWLLSFKSTGLDPLKLLAKLSNGRFIKPADVQDSFINATFSRNHAWLILPGEERAYLYDLKDTKPEVPVKVIDWFQGNGGFSPDNRWLLTTLKNGGVQVWNLSTIKTNAAPRLLPDISGINLDSREIPPEYENLKLTEFSPDGRWIVTCDVKDELNLFDLQVQPIPKRISLGKLPDYSSPNVTFSPDSKWLSILVPDQVAKFWSLGDAVKPEDFFGQSAGITQVDFSPNSRWVCAQMKLGGVHVHDLNPPLNETKLINGKLANDLYLPGSNGPFTFRGFSSGGDWLFLSARNVVQAWHLSETGGSFSKKDPFTLRGHDSPIKFVAFGDDSRWLTTAGDDNVIRLWNLRNLQPTTQPRVLRHQFKTTTEFSPDNRWVLAKGPGNEAKLWDLLDGNTLREPISFVVLRKMSEKGEQPDKPNKAQPDKEQPDEEQSDTAYRRGSSFSADGRWLITGPAEGEEEERVWDLLPLRKDSHAAMPVAHKLCKVKEDVAIFSPDGRYVVAVCSDGVVRAWDVPLGDPRSASFELGTMQPAKSRFEFSPDSRWLVTIPVTGPVRIWNMKTRGTEAPRMLKLDRRPAPFDMPTINFSNDGRWLIASDDESLRLWDLNDMSRELRPISEVPKESFTEPEFSADSRWLMLDDEDQILLWDLRPNKSNRQPTTHSYSDQSSPYGPEFYSHHFARFSPDGRWLVLVDGDDKAVLWDLSGDGKPRLSELKGHWGNLGPFTFSRLSRWLISDTGRNSNTDEDSSRKQPGSNVVIWDLQSGNTVGKILPGATLLIDAGNEMFQSTVENGMLFGPGDQWLITGYVGHGSAFWDLTRREPFASRAGGSFEPLSFEESWSAPGREVVFSPDGRWIVAEDEKNKNFELWDLSQKGREIRPLPLIIPSPDAIGLSFSFTSDSRFLICATDDSLSLFHLRSDELKEIARKAAADVLTPAAAAAELSDQNFGQPIVESRSRPSTKRRKVRHHKTQ